MTRLGFLGCGPAARHHAAAFLAAGADIVAATARSDSSANWQAFAAIAPNARYAGSGAQLMADNDVEALVVCLPWNEMPNWTERLLACAKPVLLEKPIALDSTVLKDVLGRVRPTADKVVGYNRRYYGTVRRLAERIGQGGLKAVYAIISEDIGRQLKNHGESVLPHLFAFSSAHSIDLLMHLLGPLTVRAMYGFDERGYPLPLRSYNGVLETANGIPVFLSLNADDPVNAGLRFLFDDHTSWQLAPLETLKVFQGYDIAPESGGSRVRRYTPRLIEQVDETADYKPGFHDQAMAFLAGDRQIAGTLDESVKLLELIESITNTTR